MKIRLDGVEIRFECYETLGGTPASCRIVIPRKLAIVKYSAEHFKNLTPEERRFTLLHECGHAVLNTADERAVDRWAHAQYFKMGGSQKRAFFAVSNQLDPDNNPEHEDRVIRQFYRSKHYNFLNGHTTWRKFLKQKYRDV